MSGYCTQINFLDLKYIDSINSFDQVGAITWFWFAAFLFPFVAICIWLSRYSHEEDDVCRGLIIVCFELITLRGLGDDADDEDPDKIAKRMYKIRTCYIQFDYVWYYKHACNINFY